MLTEESEEKDQLTELITNRLGNRQQTMERFEELERQIGNEHHRRAIAFTSIAAAIVAFVMVAPFMFDSTTSIDDYNYSITSFRASGLKTAEIESAIGRKDYSSALSMIEPVLRKSDLRIKLFDGVGYDKYDDELEYEIEMEKVQNSELRWAYILLLVRDNQIELAQKELKTYLKHKEWCDNADEAMAMKSDLKKKNKNIFEKWVTFYQELL